MADFGVGSVISEPKLPTIQVNNGKEDQPLKAAVQAPNQADEEQGESNAVKRTENEAGEAALGRSINQFA